MRGEDIILVAGKVVVSCVMLAIELDDCPAVVVINSCTDLAISELLVLGIDVLSPRTARG